MCAWIEISGSRVEQCLTNMVGEVKFPSWVRVRFCNMGPGVIMLQNDLIVSFIILRSFIFDRTIQLDHLLSAAIRSDGLLQFQNLVKYDTFLIPQYGKHKLNAMNIRLWLRRGCFIWMYPSFSLLTIRWRKLFFLYLSSKISHIVFRRSIALSVKSCGS